MPLYIATAGWSLRKEHFAYFPAAGTHLERYSDRLNAVEINSSFYRPHQHKTYERWACSTPDCFRFAVKLAKQITHIARICDARLQIDQFAAQVSGLHEKLGAVLVQLPPSLSFEQEIAKAFFKHLKQAIPSPIYCEPRHPTWFRIEADRLLADWGVSRVAADPAIVASASAPGGLRKNVYFRYHGSPRMYYSNYDADWIEELSRELSSLATSVTDVWCVFDNTAEGFAALNALRLTEIHNNKGLPR